MVAWAWWTGDDKHVHWACFVFELLCRLLIEKPVSHSSLTRFTNAARELIIGGCFVLHKCSMGSPGSCSLKLLYLYFWSMIILTLKFCALVVVKRRAPGSVCTCPRQRAGLSSVSGGCQQHCLVLLTACHHMHVQSCQRKGTPYFRKERSVCSRLSALFWFLRSSQERSEVWVSLCLEFNCWSLFKECSRCVLPGISSATQHSSCPLSNEVSPQMCSFRGG